MDTYQHLMPTMPDAATRAFEAALGDALGGTVAESPETTSEIDRKSAGGRGRIRTSVGYAGDFTDRSLWPLGHPPGER